MTEAAAERFEVLKATFIEQIVDDFRYAVKFGVDPVGDLNWIAEQPEIKLLASLLATRELLPGVYTFDLVEDKHIKDAAALVLASIRLSLAAEQISPAAPEAQQADVQASSGVVTGVSVSSSGAGYSNRPRISFVSPTIGRRPLAVAKPRTGWYKDTT